MISRRTIFQAMNAARVLSDVATDGAGRLARWIGHIIKTVRGYRSRKMRVHQSGLDHRNAILWIDFQNLSHAREFDHDTTTRGERASRQPSTRTAWREAHAFVGEKLQDFGCLFS